MKPVPWKKLGFLLFCGLVLLPLSQVRFGVGLLAWVAPVPFIIYLKSARGMKSRLVLAVALILAWALASAKYITPPLPYFLILLNGVSYGIVNGIGFLGWDWLQRKLPSVLANLGFGAVFVVVEWLQHTFTPMASNGAAAYTQIENLPFLQLTALVGIAGPCFLMGWFAAILGDQLHEKKLLPVQFTFSLLIICLVHIGGAIRIGAPFKTPTVRAAAVGTGFSWFGGELPAREETLAVNQSLFQDTARAARAGAKIVVWNEVSTIVSPEEEPDFLAEARNIAKEHSLHLVTSYLVTKTLKPLKFENKYTWIGPDGEILDMYLKHKPLPGEPSIPGDGKAKVVETDFGRVTGAICYEMDFPTIGLDRSRKGADLVFVPSSDTAGVDPFHTQVAAIRAIEGGYSILRSTRMGLSAGIDPRGRIRGWLSSNETDERILHVTLPSQAVPTLYSAIGDAFAYLALAFVCCLVGVRFLRRRR